MTTNIFPNATIRRQAWEERVSHALARFGGGFILHAVYCNDEPCTCTPYVVKKGDPRTAYEICAAADRWQRDN